MPPQARVELVDKLASIEYNLVSPAGMYPYQLH